MLTDYFLKYHADDVMTILEAPDDSMHYPIYVNFVTLFGAEPEAANNILRKPRLYLPLCDASAVKCQKLLAQSHHKIKQRIHTRITSTPHRANHENIGEFVTTTGIAVRISQPSVLKLVKRWYCKKCEHITAVNLSWELQTFKEPKQCEKCFAKSLRVENNVDADDCVDYQEVKIQEKVQTDSSSSYNEGMQVILMSDLVDQCAPGNDVEVSGVVIERWTQIAEGKRPEATTVMLANSLSILRKVLDSNYSEIEITEIFRNYWERYEGKPLEGRNNILASICPQLFGMYFVKLALAVVLAAGVSKLNQTGVRVRGEPHLLMIGDPGTGKSQILRTAARLAVRSVLTTGVGTTAAGLTAAAVKDTDGWHLEGGALVLADGGVCCVDEFTTMNSNDRASLHEAMEQQTISIAKAGLVSTLNSRCSVIAAINPVGGKFVEGVEMKTKLGNPLLSRFDLILQLRDNKNLEWDRMTAEHLLRAACDDPDDQDTRTVKKPMELLKSDNLWDEESLREYFAYIHTLEPTLTEEADVILRATFLHHRKNPNRREERTTVRLLESLIRLAEGHARLMYKKEVDIMDAIVAAQLVGTIPTYNDAGCPFPKDPMAVFNQETTELLELLGLEHLLGSSSDNQQ
ncbi:DNA helicase MCM9 [Diachasma alloeum]|uniref:DNA helicase MCM9 n=1 Tax=Diachasma alloeum TaxID=454923 RepID=UPI0007383095|nr:DNA helicase MCM9 [Diachasma alloeum]